MSRNRGDVAADEDGAVKLTSTGVYKQRSAVDMLSDDVDRKLARSKVFPREEKEKPKSKIWNIFKKKSASRDQKQSRLSPRDLPAMALPENPDDERRFRHRKHAADEEEASSRGGSRPRRRGLFNRGDRRSQKAIIDWDRVVKAQKERSKAPAAEGTENRPLYPGSYLLFTHAIPGTMNKTRSIKIRGCVDADARRFHIDLQCGSAGYPTESVALHLNPRFLDNRYVFRNSFFNNAWGTGESHQTYFPFAEGQKFTLIITVDDECFKIFVDKELYTEYNHRIYPLDKITHVSFHGDVEFQEMKFYNYDLSED